MFSYFLVLENINLQVVLGPFYSITLYRTEFFTASLPWVLTLIGRFGVPAQPIYYKVPINFSPNGFNQMSVIILHMHSFLNPVIFPTGIILTFFSKE